MATARFFALDSVADTIATNMQNVINVDNAVYFYYSFCSYGYPLYEYHTFHWILRNFSYWNNTNHELFCSKVLSHIEEEFMEKLVKDKSLIVKNEMDLYSILKRWMVDKMKLRADYDFFKMWSRPEPFLETEEGNRYERIFSLLNLEQLCRHIGNIDQLKKDNILPTSWIHRACADSYMRLVKLSNISTQNFSPSSAFSCRLAIFHTNYTTFKATTVDFCGFHFKFTWVKCCLIVTRHQPLKSLCFSGSITIAFRYNFLTPGELTAREPGTKVLEFNQGASFELASCHAKLGVDPADSKKVIILELFPKIISIQMELKNM